MATSQVGKAPPTIQDLQDRSATELSYYFIHAMVVITATSVTVDPVGGHLRLLHEIIELTALPSGKLRGRAVMIGTCNLPSSLTPCNYCCVRSRLATALISRV